MTSLERVSENVFRAKRCDLNKSLTLLFEELRDNMMCDFSYMVITKRNDSKLNGSARFINGIENDYRSHYLIVVEKEMEVAA